MENRWKKFTGNVLIISFQPFYLQRKPWWRYEISMLDPICRITSYLPNEPLLRALVSVGRHTKFHYAKPTTISNTEDKPPDKNNNFSVIYSCANVGVYLQDWVLTADPSHKLSKKNEATSRRVVRTSFMLSALCVSPTLALAVSWPLTAVSLYRVRPYRVLHVIHYPLRYTAFE